MVKKILNSAFGVLLFWSSHSSASLVGPSISHHIEKLKVDSRFSPANVEVYVSGTPSNDGCANTTRYSFALDESGKAMYSMLLAAKSSSRQVKVWIDGCNDGAPKIQITQIE